MKRTTLQAPVTRTSATNGSGVDISTLIDTSLTCVIEIFQMSAGAEARLSIETSSDGFTTVQDGPVISVLGSVSNSAAIRFSFRTRDFVDFANGIAGTQARLALTRLTGNSPSITVGAFFDIASA